MIEPRAHFQFLRHDSVDPREEEENEATTDHHNSESAWETEGIHPDLEYEEMSQNSTTMPLNDELLRQVMTYSSKHDSRTNVKLLFSFFCLIVCGAGNAVLAKLQTLPMYNYPNVLNLYANFLYIPICFAYILPVQHYGTSITPEQRALPKLPFFIMGALDGLAATMQTFAAVYVPGSLLVLLPQACIPVSIMLSKSLTGERFTWIQYLGAMVVLLGVIIVLEPVVTLRHSPEYYCEAIDPVQDCTICQLETDDIACLSHTLSERSQNNLNNNNLLNGTTSPFWLLEKDASSTAAQHDDATQLLCQWLPLTQASREREFLVAVWSLVLLFSTIPMTLSILYKKRALDDSIQLDPIYLNGWVSIFRFAFALVAAVPAAYLASPSVLSSDLLSNLQDGVQCFLGQATVDTGCHPDARCESLQAALYMNLSLVCYVLYSVCILFVLKYGSSAVLFLALTAIVPLGQLAFALPWLPEPSHMHASDWGSLITIVIGLAMYRFSERRSLNVVDDDEISNDDQNTGSPPLAPSRSWHDDVLEQLRQPLLLAGDV